MLQATRYACHTTTAHFFTFVVALLYMCLLGLFLQPFGCFRYPQEIICKRQSRHRIFPTVTHCYTVSIATIMSLLRTLNRFGDSVHPCATPSKISTFDIPSSKITALQAHSVIFFIILHMFPLIPRSQNVFHNPFIHTVS